MTVAGQRVDLGREVSDRFSTATRIGMQNVAMGHCTLRMTSRDPAGWSRLCQDLISEPSYAPDRGQTVKRAANNGHDPPSARDNPSKHIGFELLEVDPGKKALAKRDEVWQWEMKPWKIYLRRSSTEVTTV